MHWLLIQINRLLMALVAWYVGREFSYFRFYDLNQRLMRASKLRFPGTWLELDWISEHPWDLYKNFEEDHLLNAFRRHALINEVREIERRKIQGDFLELGVYKGFSAYLMLSYSSENRNYFGIDTFAGLSEPVETIDGSHWVKGDLAFSEYAAMAKLESFKNRVKLFKGEIPEILNSIPVAGLHWALVHVDLDLYEPTKNALIFAWENITPGGSLVCDDYGSALCPGASKAVDEFLYMRSDFQAFKSVVGGIIVRKNG